MALRQGMAVRVRDVGPPPVNGRISISLPLSTDHAHLRRLVEMKQLYAYDGEDTCAADGMCKEKCPVKINTGAMIKAFRAREMQEVHPAFDKIAEVGVSTVGAAHVRTLWR